MTTLPLTQHAKQRRREMGVTEDQIALVLGDPDLVYPGNPPYHRERTCYQRDHLVVVIENSSNWIVTLLWHGKEGRDDE